MPLETLIKEYLATKDKNTWNTAYLTDYLFAQVELEDFHNWLKEKYPEFIVMVSLKLVV
jgi:hypothetical protein